MMPGAGPAGANAAEDHMEFALTCIGLFGLLVVGLGLGVSIQRDRTKRSIGCSEDPTDPLFKWIRAHCNACEFAPMLAILIFALASTGHEGWNGTLYAGAVAARYSHAAGMILSPTLEKGHPLRLVGALGTYAVGLILSLIAIF
jgi:uncharacterized membrane protein YecN with MAPEG domain